MTVPAPDPRQRQELQELLDELVARPGVHQELTKVAALTRLFAGDGVDVTIEGDPGDLEDAGLADGIRLDGLTLAPGEPSYGAPPIETLGGGPVVATLAAFAVYVLRVNAEVEVARRERQELADAQQRLTEQNILLRELAVVDELTGLRNRRFFDRTLQYEIDRMRRYDRQMSVVLLDVDHFKSVNDRFGHPFGDEVLKAVARCLERGIRKCDLAARYGGEEFALVLPETGCAGALHVAERIRESIEVMELDGQKVTASFGVATVDRGWAGDIPGVVRAADQALYQAKRTGRNKVVTVELQGETP
jgi:diguanylate cyclase (GGDEF)-like protein